VKTLIESVKAELGADVARALSEDLLSEAGDLDPVALEFFGELASIYGKHASDIQHAVDVLAHVANLEYGIWQKRKYVGSIDFDKMQAMLKRMKHYSIVADLANRISDGEFSDLTHGGVSKAATELAAFSK
jgi:hypothetical protein